MLEGYTCAVTGHSPATPFNVLDGDLCRLAQATVQDLLEYAAERHNVDCGCDLKISGRAWFTSIPLSKANDVEWATVGHEPIPVNTSLRALPAAADSSTVQLVLAGEQSSLIDYLYLYREKIFTRYSVEDAAAYKRFGASYALLPEKSTSFATMCSTPGSVFVDKSRSLLAMFQLSMSGVNIIRRPKGFGKSTFLSMFDAFFDPLSAHAHFPFTFTQDMPAHVLDHHNQLLVFALDFADLSFDDCIGYHALRAECNRLLDAAAQKFYTRYRTYLTVSEEEMARPGVSPTFFYINRWAQLSDWKLCFTIDNYTAPFLERPEPVYEDAISRHIFPKLSNCMMYGLIVGDDVPYCSEWPGLSDIGVDISSSSALFDAVGFTLADVAALGRAISVDLSAALPPYAPISTGADTKTVYSPTDVLAIARQALKSGRLQDAPLEVRTFTLDLYAKQEEDVAVDSSDFVMSDDVDIFTGGFLSDEEDGADGSDSRTPPMTMASSSSGSSSSPGSSSTSPSGPTSASTGKQTPIAIAEEPSSPLEAYGKKPWDSNKM